ncbi:MAG: hypothetical protein P8I74_08645, partial [Phycisphaerales bacterium]|nr:hypothetical protein [Phycisphaerales bacterium]
MLIALMLASVLSTAAIDEPASVSPILVPLTADKVPARPGKEVRIDVPLPGGDSVPCILEPFSVVTPETRFVIGSRSGNDVDLQFDPTSVRLLRGAVEGDPDSHVVLAVHGAHLRGRIHRGDGSIYHLAETTKPRLPNSRPPHLPMCGLDHSEHAHVGAPTGAPRGDDESPDTAIYRLRIAVETDFEYRQLFESTDEAAAYAVLCYGLIGDIFLRDAGVRVEMTYLRLWETEDDLFNVEDPLSEFRQYWN